MRYRPLMVLGTGSDVGKSVITAALCRIFYREGIKVAPFKAQNMALNSFITPEGGEMGRAQVVQAQAAGLIPHVDMNPILLKPSSDTGSQVIVHGTVRGNFTSQDYYRLKPKLVRDVMASFNRLAGQYELIVLEGAGSAAELNLKKSDLVNFSMAARVNAAVVLVADIERGGVFAATIGTNYLLTRRERTLLAGFIINKFRGDPALFEEGVRIIEQRTKRPVLGVLPYIKDMAIPQEDSVALDKKRTDHHWTDDARLRVGVVRLPHISNYTDFDALEREPAVDLRYLTDDSFPDGLDLLILPGSKNTISDLLSLKQVGLFEKIRRFAAAGGKVIGVCGGFQMLGRTIDDPDGVEGAPRREEGLGLLPVMTVLAKTKTTTQVRAVETGIFGERDHISGYEIHMGETHGEGGGSPAFEILERNGQKVTVQDGWVSPDRNVWGGYIHGLFDREGFRGRLIAGLLADKGVTYVAPESSYDFFLESQFERLADYTREHLDMERLFALIKA